MIMRNDPNITGVIIAGGKSRRMGVDKGFLRWKGKTFTEHIISALQPLVNEILIVSDHSQYDIFGYPRISDVFHQAGPLGGVYSGLMESKNHLNLVLSCDVPLISTSLLNQLVQNYKTGDDAVICMADNRIMPLVGLYSKTCEHRCLELLQEDELRMMRLLKRLDQVQYVSVTDDEKIQLTNINSPVELKEIENEY